MHTFCSCHRARWIHGHSGYSVLHTSPSSRCICDKRDAEVLVAKRGESATNTKDMSGRVDAWKAQKPIGMESAKDVRTAKGCVVCEQGPATPGGWPSEPEDAPVDQYSSVEQPAGTVN